jgi:hypothetical protein
MPRAKKPAKKASPKIVPITQLPRASADTLSVRPSVEEQIRRRAYELFLQRGGHGGSPEQDWLQAEAEVRARHFA